MLKKTSTRFSRLSKSGLKKWPLNYTVKPTLAASASLCIYFCIFVFEYDHRIKMATTSTNLLNIPMDDSTLILIGYFFFFVYFSLTNNPGVLFYSTAFKNVLFFLFFGGIFFFFLSLISFAKMGMNLQELC